MDTIEKKDQKDLRMLCKIATVFTSIFRIIAWIGLGCVAVAMIIIPLFLSKINFKEQKGEIFDKEFTYSFENNDFEFTFDGKTKKLGHIEAKVNIGKYLQSHSNGYYIGVIETYAGIGIASLFIFILILGNLKKLFKNIGTEDTPFIEENAKLFRNMANLLFLTIIIPLVAEFVVSLLLKENIFNIRTSWTDTFYIFAASILSYVFSYGCKLQAKSDLKIYSED